MTTLAIRRATVDDAEDIARIRIDGWRMAYRGLIPDAYLESMELQPSRAIWEKVLSVEAPGVCVFVAVNDAQVVGFAAGNMLPEPKQGFDAELTGIYVQREYQRAGLGHRLLGEVAGALRPQSRSGLIVWVLAASKPARAFCEQLGAELLTQQTFQWDGMDLIEAGYGWRDLAALVVASQSLPAAPKSILQ